MNQITRKYLQLILLIVLVSSCQQFDSSFEQLENSVQQTEILDRNVTEIALLNQYSCILNVTDYGILAGGQDNTLQFKSLMDSLLTVSDRCPYIFFPEGTFYGVFNIPKRMDGLSIIGAGVDLTTLKMHDGRFGYPGAGGVLSTLGKETSIRSLTINGNGESAHNNPQYTSNLTSDGYVCLYVGGEGSKISNIKLTNSFNKQSVISASNIEIKNSHFLSNFENCKRPDGTPCTGMDVDGIHIYGETTNHHTFNIENCTFQGQKRTGVFIEQLITGVNIEKNHFIKCIDGIKQQGRSTGINIVNNFFDQCNRGINSQSGLGIMKIDNNTFHIQERVMLLHGGMKFESINTNTSLSFTHDFNGQVYQKLGHKIEIVNNNIKFIQGPFSSQGSDVINISTYNTNISKIIPAKESRYNYVQELAFDNNTINSQGISAAPDLFSFRSHDFEGAHGFINNIKIFNNYWTNGRMGPFSYSSNGDCLAELSVLLVRDNTFKNIQGLRLYSKYLAFEDNIIYNNPYDAAIIRAVHADIYRNTFFAESSNPTRSKRLVIKRLFTEILHQGDNYRYLDGSSTAMVNYNSYVDPCL